MISKERRKSILYAFVALLFSIVLYFNANGQSVQDTLSGNEAYTQNVSDVSVQLLYDADQYYIHGYESTVTAKLSSANRVQLNAEAIEDTRMFRVTADLTGLGEGTHEVPLKIRNLSSAVKAKLEPDTITVTIEKKVTKEFEVTPLLTTESTPAGFELNDLELSPKKVTVTTGDQTLEEIQQVVARIEPAMITDDGVDTRVTVQALNSAGEPLSIVSDPVQVTAKATVTKPTKTIRLYGTAQGTPADNVESYDFSFSDIEAEVTGSESQLAQLGNSITIPIDISGIVHRTTRNIDIPVESGLSITPPSIDVGITPVLKTSTENTSRSNSGNSGNSGGSTTSGAVSTPANSSSSTTRQSEETQSTSSEGSNESSSETTQSSSQPNSQEDSSEN
ncbi:CdaR family protein [Enterococcus mundtii]|uniref:CdaR family protein n=1 Tax=Enterococcus mundtii TaxID=53346 RepID=UPI000BB54AE8|nr:CdaR family protein [Enterococcus mundtii]PJK26721.1 hypothetical protein CV769_03240 [Enterococcus mundtii]